MEQTRQEHTYEYNGVQYIGLAGVAEAVGRGKTSCRILIKKGVIKVINNQKLNSYEKHNKIQ